MFTTSTPRIRENVLQALHINVSLGRACVARPSHRPSPGDIHLQLQPGGSWPPLIARCRARPAAPAAASDGHQPTSVHGEGPATAADGGYVPLDFSPPFESGPIATATTNAAASAAVPAPPMPFGDSGGGGSGGGAKKDFTDIGALWGLFVLSLSYLHHSTCGFALPALLPIISGDLLLSDSQGALLTAGYTILYALTLVPVGLLADRTDRPRLLAGGVALWSLLTIAASRTGSFGELLATRVGFAAAQATQNPICFGLIPELFPRNKTTAMAVYNSAIYVGRALSFAGLILAGQLGVPQGMLANIDIGYNLVPLDKVDLSLVSVLYTQGDFAAVTPVYSYIDDLGEGAAAAAGAGADTWRVLLRSLGIPGLAISALMLLTMDEPRTPGKGLLGNPMASSRFFWTNAVGGGKDGSKDGEKDGGKGGSKAGEKEGSAALAGVANAAIAAPSTAAAAAGIAVGAAAMVAAAAGGPAPAAAGAASTSAEKLVALLSRPAFLSLTAAAALNDVGSWALVAWQATFYQRVYSLTPDSYAPLLAVVIPVGGIIGGVGAGLSGDWLNRIGARGWLTAGANIVAAPVIAVSLLTPDYKQSFAALLVGFALSEAWRAPAAVCLREVSPEGVSSTASAVHLCIRNLVGGLGPIAVALLSTRVGLQLAMLLVPACYLASGLAFLATEAVVKADKAKLV